MNVCVVWCVCVVVCVCCSVCVCSVYSVCVYVFYHSHSQGNGIQWLSMHHFSHVTRTWIAFSRQCCPFTETATSRLKWYTIHMCTVFDAYVFMWNKSKMYTTYIDIHNMLLSDHARNTSVCVCVCVCMCVCMCVYNE